jgi:hypothetical protein
MRRCRRRDPVGDLRQGGAAGRTVAEQVADGLDDFLPAAVPDGDRDVVAGGAGRGVLGRGLERVPRTVRQGVEHPGQMEGPAGVRFGPDVVGELLDDAHQERHLGVVAADQVLGRADEDRNEPDAGAVRTCAGAPSPEAVGQRTTAPAGSRTWTRRRT